MARKRPRGKKPPSPKMRSGFEGKISLALDAAGVEYSYETERVSYVVPETKRAYLPDFICIRSDGSKLYIEGKGLFDAQNRSRMILIVRQNPDKDIRMLFMRDNPIRKGSKTKYSDWAQKNNIPYAVSPAGIPPKEWIW